MNDEHRIVKEMRSMEHQENLELKREKPLTNKPKIDDTWDDDYMLDNMWFDMWKML